MDDFNRSGFFGRGFITKKEIVPKQNEALLPYLRSGALKRRKEKKEREEEKKKVKGRKFHHECYSHQFVVSTNPSFIPTVTVTRPHKHTQTHKHQHDPPLSLSFRTCLLRKPHLDMVAFRMESTVRSR